LPCQKGGPFSFQRSNSLSSVCSVRGFGRNGCRQALRGSRPCGEARQKKKFPEDLSRAAECPASSSMGNENKNGPVLAARLPQCGPRKQPLSAPSADGTRLGGAVRILHTAAGRETAVSIVLHAAPIARDLAHGIRDVSHPMAPNPLMNALRQNFHLRVSRSQFGKRLRTLLGDGRCQRCSSQGSNALSVSRAKLTCSDCLWIRQSRPQGETKGDLFWNASQAWETASNSSRWNMVRPRRRTRFLVRKSIEQSRGRHNGQIGGVIGFHKSNCCSGIF